MRSDKKPHTSSEQSKMISESVGNSVGPSVRLTVDVTGCCVGMKVSWLIGDTVG